MRKVKSSFPQLLRSMSTRSDWGEGSSSTKEELKEDDIISMLSEMSRTSFELVRTSLDKKVIRYKTRTVSEPIYEDELLKNMTMEVCYEFTNTNSNSLYISINVCLEGYNKYELCVYIDSGCSICVGKRTLFLEFMWKKAKNSL